MKLCIGSNYLPIIVIECLQAYHARVSQYINRYICYLSGDWPGRSFSQTHSSHKLMYTDVGPIHSTPLRPIHCYNKIRLDLFYA